VPKSSTLDDLERPMHSIAEKMRLREHTTKILIKIDPFYQRQKCSPMTLLSDDIRLCGYSRAFPGKGVKRQWGCQQRQFSACSLAMAIISETLEMTPALLYSDTQSVVSFSVIPKCVTLNDLD